jgi:hypothetical protein
VREQILTTIVRRDKAVSLGVVKPFHSARGHARYLAKNRAGTPDLFEFQDRATPEPGQHVT